MPAANVLTGFVHRLRRAAGDGPTDGELLARFADRRDETAFADLVGRHGRLVLGVARRHLPDRQAAEDVVQLTFLALARQASRLGRTTSLVNWLFTVALRQARLARRRTARRTSLLRRLANPAASPDPLAEVSGRELLTVIDDELARLPAEYRLPLLLCALEGLSRDEAALRLGWPTGSVKGRLERGRELLRTRLAARGLTVPAVLAGGLLVNSAGAMPAGLVREMTRAAIAMSSAAAPVKMLIAIAVVLTALGVGTGVALLPGGQPTPKANPPVLTAAGQVAPQPRVDAEGVPLPPGVLARLGSSRMRHPGNVYRIEFAPDGRSLVSAGWDGIRVSDAVTGKLLHFFPTSDKSSLLSVIDSAGGRELLTFWRGEPSSIRVLDAASGRELRRLDIEEGQVQSATISPSGRLVAVAFPDSKTVRVYDTNTGKERFRLSTTFQVGRGIAFTPDDRTLAVAELGASFHLYDATTGAVTADIKTDGTQGLFFTFSSNGSILATLTLPITGLATDINLWDVPSRKLLRRISGPNVLSTMHVAFSPDGSMLAGTNRNKDVVIWETATGKEICTFPCQPVTRMSAFSPDSRTLAVASNHGTITLWDVATGKLLPASAEPIIGVFNLRFVDDGRRLLGAADRTLAWNVAAASEVRGYAAAPAHSGQFLVSPDERQMATLRTQGTDHAIDLWNASSGELIRTFPGKAQFWPAAFTPDSRRIVASDTNKEIHVFDVTTGDKLGTLIGHSGSPSRLVVSPDGRRLASATGAGRAGDFVRLWDLDAFREARRLEPRGLAVFDMAFSADGRFLVAAGGTNPGGAGDRGEIRIWDVDSGREVRSIAGDSGYVDCVAFSPDGKTIAAASFSAFRLWETATGTERHRFIGHTGAVHALAFSPDGRTIAASSPDAPVYLWDIHGRSDPQPQPTANDLNQCWTDLAVPHAAVSFRAIRRLIAAPDAAITLLRDRLKPASPIDEGLVKQLIAQLDSPKFADRQAAAKELDAVADRAADQLRTTLTKTKSAEVRQALQTILDRLDVATPETLRALRSVEVLEQIGSPAAREQLKALAGGAAGATLTRAAAEALKRLGLP
jgi:RNA polymerase sigma factor (sigma-70 family)